MCYVLRVTLTLLRRVILVREWWLLSIIYPRQLTYDTTIKNARKLRCNGFFALRFLLSDVWFDIIFMFILHKDSLFPGHSYQPGLQCLGDMEWPCAWGSRQWLPRVTLRLPWALDFRAFSPERWNEWCTRVNCMAQGSFSVATLSLPIILYQPLNIRDFIEYGIANLIIWQQATFTQIFYKIFANTTKVDREGFSR